MRIKKIACCTDFSENAELAFEAAVEMAEKYDARLELLHVLPPVINPMLSDSEWVLPADPNDTLLLQLEEKMEQTYSSRINAEIKHNLVVLSGHVSSEILRYLAEKQVDIVILGAYGLTGMGLVLFGSVAKRVSHKAPCSVMVVRQPG
jgi:universal stress protein A